jgi:hypothetical protein
VSEEHLRTLVYVHEAVLRALIGKLVSSGALGRGEAIEMLDRVEQDLAPKVPDEDLAREALDILRQAASVGDGV